MNKKEMEAALTWLGTFSSFSELTNPRSIEAWYTLFYAIDVNLFKEACKLAVLDNTKGKEITPGMINLHLSQVKESKTSFYEPSQADINAYHDAMVSKCFIRVSRRYRSGKVTYTYEPRVDYPLVPASYSKAVMWEIGSRPREYKDWQNTDTF